MKTNECDKVECRRMRRVRHRRRGRHRPVVPVRLRRRAPLDRGYRRSGRGTPKTVVEFVYDALGRRIEKKIYADGSLSKTVRYIYSGQNVIEEYVDDSGWVLDAKYVHGIGIDNVLTIERGFGGSVERWYYLHDGLSSVTELLDEDGALDQAYEYDAWGNPTIYDPNGTTIKNPYLYTNRRWDAEITL
jgi:YD repeat-containing protein